MKTAKNRMKHMITEAVDSAKRVFGLEGASATDRLRKMVIEARRNPEKFAEASPEELAESMDGINPDEFQRLVNVLGERDEAARVLREDLPQHQAQLDEAFQAKEAARAAANEAERAFAAAQLRYGEQMNKVAALQRQVGNLKGDASNLLNRTYDRFIDERIRVTEADLPHKQRLLEARPKIEKALAAVQHQVSHLEVTIEARNGTTIPTELMRLATDRASLASLRGRVKALQAELGELDRVQLEIDAIHQKVSEISREKLVPENFDLTWKAAK